MCVCIISGYYCRDASSSSEVFRSTSSKELKKDRHTPSCRRCIMYCTQCIFIITSAPHHE